MINAHQCSEQLVDKISQLFHTLRERLKVLTSLRDKIIANVTRDKLGKFQNKKNYKLVGFGSWGSHINLLGHVISLRTNGEVNLKHFHFGVSQRAIQD